MWSCWCPGISVFPSRLPCRKGKPLTTLREAGTYISKLPKAEHESTEWQTAVQCLMQAADKAARRREGGTNAKL